MYARASERRGLVNPFALFLPFAFLREYIAGPSPPFVWPPGFFSSRSSRGLREVKARVLCVAVYMHFVSTTIYRAARVYIILSLSAAGIFCAESDCLFIFKLIL